MRNLFLIICLAFSTLSFTQDEVATRILNDVSKTYQAYKTIKAKFTMIIENGQDNSKLSQSGVLHAKGKKFRIQLGGQEIFCDGKTMWTYLKDANEVQISKYVPDEQEINPSEIFSMYKKGFLSRYMGDVTLDNRSMYLIELTPTDKNKPFHKVKLWIEKSGNKIIKMSILNKNGINATYLITSFTGNINITDNYFKFDSKEKPGVLEIDLR